MLTEALFTLFKNICDVVLWIFNIPQLPEEVLSYVDQLFEYIAAGGGLLANYTNLGYLVTLFGVILAIDVGIGIYHIVMWILAKIPIFKVDR